MLDTFVSSALKIGLHLRPQKCYEVHSFPEGEGCLDNSEPVVPCTVNGVVIPQKRWGDPSLNILGVPFGPELCQEKAITASVQKIKHSLAKLQALSDVLPSLIHAYLVSKCLPPVMAHLLRVTSLHTGLAQPRKADKLIADGILKAFDIPLTSPVRHLVHVPSKQGGLGVMCLEMVAKVAPGSTWLTLLRNLEDSKPTLHSMLTYLDDPSSTWKSLYMLEATSRPAELPSADVAFDEEGNQLVPQPLPKKIQAYAYGKAVALFAERSLMKLDEGAYVRRFTGPDYLLAFTPKSNRMPSAVAIRDRLAYMAGDNSLSLLSRVEGGLCPHDKKEITHTHPLSCRKTAAMPWTDRHDATRACLAAALRKVPGAEVLEEHQIRVEHNKRPDVILQIGSKTWVIDVSLVDVCSDSTINQPSHKALRKRESEKTSAYKKYIENFALEGESTPEFVPFVLTSLGAPAEKAKAFLKKLSKASPVPFQKALLIHKIQLATTHFNGLATVRWRDSVHSSLARQSFSGSKSSKSKFRRSIL
jgi:hypothetical protein